MFEYAFMRRAFAVGLLLGVIMPCIGVMIVLKRLSMLGDALSHTSLAGVAAVCWVPRSSKGRPARWYIKRCRMAAAPAPSTTASKRRCNEYAQIAQKVGPSVVEVTTGGGAD